MIVVSVNEYMGSISSISIKGHGNMEWGKDIVCAAVSSCFIGALNALKNEKSFEFKVEEGDGSVKAISELDMHDKIVLETLVIQLNTIANSFPDIVKIKVSRKEG